MEGKALPVSLELGPSHRGDAKQFHRVGPPS